jgi:hypothetical protein
MRNDLVIMMESLHEEFALDIASKFYDIVNATRISVRMANYDLLWKSLDNHKSNFNVG